MARSASRRYSSAILRYCSPPVSSSFAWFLAVRCRAPTTSPTVSIPATASATISLLPFAEWKRTTKRASAIRPVTQMMASSVAFLVFITGYSRLLCVLLDFLEDLLHRLHLLAQVVELHADVTELEVGVLLGGNGQVGQPPVLVGHPAVLLPAGQFQLRLVPGREVPGADHQPDRQHPGDREREHFLAAVRRMETDYQKGERDQAGHADDGQFGRIPGFYHGILQIALCATRLP